MQPEAKKNQTMITLNSGISIAKGSSDAKCEAIPTQMGKVVTVKTSELSKKYHEYKANRGEGKEGMDMARVRRIARSIIGSNEIPSVYNGTYWLVEPIIVNAKNKMVVDGHYTWAALNEVLKSTGWDLPVFVIEREFPKSLSNMQVVSMFNGCRKAWSSCDYVECFVKEGDPEYIKLKSAAVKLGGPFVKKNGKPNYKYVVALVNSSEYVNLRNGTFKYNPIIEERGERVKQLFYRISKTRQTSNWFDQFIKAYVKQEEANPIAFNVFMKHADKIVLDGCTSTDGWTEQFGKIWSEVITN